MNARQYANQLHLALDRCHHLIAQFIYRQITLSGIYWQSLNHWRQQDADLLTPAPFGVQWQYTCHMVYLRPSGNSLAIYSQFQCQCRQAMGLKGLSFKDVDTALQNCCYLSTVLGSTICKFKTAVNCVRTSFYRTVVRAENSSDNLPGSPHCSCCLFTGA